MAWEKRVLGGNGRMWVKGEREGDRVWLETRGKKEKWFKGKEERREKKRWWEAEGKQGSGGRWEGKKIEGLIKG